MRSIMPFKRADKLESRALVGQLVGYDSTNIYRIWMPTLSRVMRTRDVVFIRSERESYPQERELRRLVTVLDIEDISEPDAVIEQALMIPAHQAQPIRAQEADESDKADITVRQKGYWGAELIGTLMLN